MRDSTDINRGESSENERVNHPVAYILREAEKFLEGGEAYRSEHEKAMVKNLRCFLSKKSTQSDLISEDQEPLEKLRELLSKAN